MNWSKSAISMAVVFGLSACGGGGDGGGTTPPSDYEYQAYACDAAIYEKAKELRIYQVMTEAFIDGDSNHDYNDGYGTSHHKGDLQGIIDSLDYIQSLGMNAIWMTPIFDSEGSSKLDATGYFTRNYFEIDPNFGTKAQAKELVDKAHAKGMYVIFDGVFGHHKGSVTPSPNGLTPSGSDNPVSYPGTDNDTLEFYKEVASYWVTELGIDGWRLDQAYQVPVGAWGEIRKSVEDASKATTYTMNGESVNPLAYMVAEIWDGGGSQIRDEGYGPEAAPGVCSAFDFPMRYSITQTYAVEENGSGGRDATNLNAAFNAQIANPDHAVPNGFIGNHDLVRFGDLLQRGDIAQPNQQEYWARHKAAYAFLSAYSGPITMYYGEEIGDEVPGFADQVGNTTCADQGLCDDHVARNSGKVEGLASEQGGAVFNADASQADLRDYISALMTLRAANPALYKGERIAISHDDAASVFFDHKQYEDNTILFLNNTSTNSFTIDVTGEDIGSDGQLRNMLTNETIDIASGGYSIDIEGFESLFLEVLSATAEGPQQGNGGSLIGTGPLADCSAPDVAGNGPLDKEMWIRGNYNGGDGFGATPDSHKFSYKGDNIYQVVVTESATTSFGFKFAAADWSSEFATATGVAVIATEQAMSIAAGEGTESSLVIPEAGDYVYSFEINDALTGGTMMISKCE
ncbi:alpha-amylase family glycosyl hydrolase [Agarivorans sp. TSD2052]|uniref:alpha-amylase family glycosyl hydrolase n=1 Tax=Agarivorans sp. TSD2052 TaxID=2937286 RepID=UPI00200D49CF|nr:alpha-amylase family glycosyl hydrolase [Agarivorans sp. TSD2052]UPW18200.1 alpha-amylase family glycosyl hydrolase [Agarivorans sp. TSD2052]